MIAESETRDIPAHVLEYINSQPLYPFLPPKGQIEARILEYRRFGLLPKFHGVQYIGKQHVSLIFPRDERGPSRVLHGADMDAGESAYLVERARNAANKATAQERARIALPDDRPEAV